jgi:hypothetical protein
MITSDSIHGKSSGSRLVFLSSALLVLLSFIYLPDLFSKSHDHSLLEGSSLDQRRFDDSHRVVVFPPPKVVILPGPHKTGSTSLQTSFVDWTWNWLSRGIRQRTTNTVPVKTPIALPKWAWAVPDESILRMMKLKHVYPTKAFASLMGMADLDPRLGLSRQGRAETGGVITAENVKEVIQLYRTSMEEAWREKKTSYMGAKKWID